MYNTSQDKLQSKVKELKQSQSNEILCKKTTTSMEQEINELTRNSANLSNDLDETRKKLSFMTGSEEDIRHSLNGAWKEIESLTEEKNHLSDLHTNCDHSVGILSTEKENAEYRIVELEFALDDAGTNLKSLQSTYEEEKSNRMAIHMELINTQEKVDVLEDQLDREDGRAWYYQLQIKHLEEIIDEQSNTIEDLRYWNHELKDEKKSLKITLDSQVDEAVSALNAVARSATVRKAQQLLEKDNILMIEKDAMMEQAAFAVQAVAGYDKKKRKTEQDQ
jgi:chromosome segregation ATPase